jgi:hypothetical protein
MEDLKNRAYIMYKTIIENQSARTIVLDSEVLWRMWSGPHGGSLRIQPLDALAVSSAG